MTIALGVGGSIVDGFLFGLFTGGFRGFQPAGWVGSVIGAIALLVIYNKLTGRKKSTTDLAACTRPQQQAHA